MKIKKTGAKTVKQLRKALKRYRGNEKLYLSGLWEDDATLRVKGHLDDPPLLQTRTDWDS